MPTPPVYSSTACNGFTRTRRSSKSGIPSRRIKILLLLLARRKAAQKAAAGLPKFVHVVCVNFAWLKGDTNNQGQESKRTNRCTSTPQETPKKTRVQEGPSYTKYDTCTGFDRNETASAGKKTGTRATGVRKSRQLWPTCCSPTQDEGYEAENNKGSNNLPRAVKEEPSKQTCSQTQTSGIPAREARRERDGDPVSRTRLATPLARGPAPRLHRWMPPCHQYRRLLHLWA